MATQRSAKERRRSRRRAAVVLVPTAAAVFVAGTAFAYWTTSGVGTATGATGSSQTVSVTQTGAQPSGMYPNGPTQPIDFKITNPNATDIRIATVTIDVVSVTYAGGGTAATCDEDDFDIVQPNSINQDLPPGDTNFAASGATIRMLETGQDQNDCKNVRVNLSFAAA